MKRMKRAISMLLAVVMIITACPNSAFATTVNAMEGGVESHGDYRYMLLSDGTISICGYDNVPESDTEGTYLEIPDSIDNVVVTQIADGAFADNSYIDTVVIPESIAFIGESAFEDCVNLKAIAFYGELPEFNIAVFEGCDALKYFYVLNGIDEETLSSELVDAGLNDVSVLVYENPDALEIAYQEYIHTLVAELNANEQITEINSVETGDTSAATETAEEITEPVYETDLPEETWEDDIDSTDATESIKSSRSNE